MVLQVHIITKEETGNLNTDYWYIVVTKYTENAKETWRAFDRMILKNSILNIINN